MDKSFYKDKSKQLISYVDEDMNPIEHYNGEGSFVDIDGEIIENPNDKEHFMKFGSTVMKPSEFMEDSKQKQMDRWKPSPEDQDKLEDFLSEFGEYLVDEDAQLVYKISRGKFGPSFEYKKGKAVKPATKKDIAEYIDKVFFGE